MMIGRRCSQLDGEYVQPGGMAFLSIIAWWLMPGIIGMRMENAMASAPTIVSFM